MTFDSAALTALAVEFLVGFGLLLILLLAYLELRKLRAHVTSTGAIDLIDAVEPYVKQALLVAERLAAQALTDGQKAFDAVDKKRIADASYVLLPVFLKGVLSTDEWETFVEHFSKQVDDHITANHDWLIGQLGTVLTPAPAAPVTQAAINATVTAAFGKLADAVAASAPVVPPTK